MPNQPPSRRRVKNVTLRAMSSSTGKTAFKREKSRFGRPFFSGFRLRLMILPVVLALKRSQGMGQSIVADRNPKRSSINTGCSKVNASEDACVLHFFESG